MRIRLILTLTISITMLLGLAKATTTEKPIPRNIKLIAVLKDKKGNELGKVYIEDFKKDVFKKLLITKRRNGKTDTLYFIDNYVFKNSKGVDITFDAKTFNGYKIEWIKDDALQLFGIGKGANGASDPVIIAWRYKKKVFEVFFESP
ncbi:hypothetical protein GCM10023149_45130 [Mucilaginibacter gynuensis]|uniref:Uncharacterized protein n=1 Tax=Mucilaginibacter gynuensis TaxID=1302236 RepID=A0ABP8HA73_9SPHI